MSPGASSAGTSNGTRRCSAPRCRAEDPVRKPGCGARWTYEAIGGLDELEDMFERGWSDGLPVVPPTPERVEAMLRGARSRALARAGATRAWRGDARAARRLCRARRLPPGVLPGRAGGRGGSARAGLQRSRHRGDDAAGGHDPRRQRAGARARRAERRHGRARPRYAREHDDRPRAPAPAHAHGRRPSRRPRPVHARQSGQARRSASRRTRRRAPGSRSTPSAGSPPLPPR